MIKIDFEKLREEKQEKNWTPNTTDRAWLSNMHQLPKQVENEDIIFALMLLRNFLEEQEKEILQR